jgi:hypothetical protein
MDEERRKYESLSKDWLIDLVIELKQLVQQLQAQVTEIQRSKKRQLSSQKTRARRIPNNRGARRVRGLSPTRKILIPKNHRASNRAERALKQRGFQIVEVLTGLFRAEEFLFLGPG